MKIAITSQGDTLESPVDPRFGRAPWFIIVDTESGEFEAVNNEQNLNAPQGAGIQAALHVSHAGAQALVTGHCGPNAHRTLSTAGIKVYTGAEGTVAEAVEAFKAGKFQSTSSPDVEGHWV